MKSLKTLMYSGIKYFFCILYTNSLLHFCAPGAKFFSHLTFQVEAELSEGCWDTNFPQRRLPLSCSNCFKRAEVDEA